MDFNQKLQTLRKERGLTQEELAAALFVSRTAVSKWESGRGLPSIDSLKAIAAFFSVSVDELLTGEERRAGQKTDPRIPVFFGLTDVAAALLFLLPLFGQRTEAGAQGVSLLALTGTAPYLRGAYGALLAGLVLCGGAVLALGYRGKRELLPAVCRVSMALSGAGVLLCLAGAQPYPGAALFGLLAIKAFLWAKWG